MRLAGAGRAAAACALLLLSGALTATPSEAQIAVAGGVRGTVRDAEFETGLAGVRVTIVEAFLSTQTDADGQFAFERVPPGVYTLAVTRDGYQRQVVSDIVIAPGTLAEVRVALELEVVEMDELVVTGSDPLAGTEVGMLEIRSDAVAMQDAISSEIMSRAGVSDAAGALKLVVGASVVGGKYATVRGLSDRYTGTTLNGVRIPSADPRRRAVQLDLFPTGTIESVTVTKSFTPDLQGDFTGGGVDIKTKSIPEGPLLSVAAMTEGNSIATGNEDFVTYEGGGTSALGIDSSRDFPEAAATPLPPLPAFPIPPRVPTPEQTAASQAYDAVVRSFTPVIGTSTEAPGRNSGVSVLAGNRYTLDGGTVFGMVGALTWTHKYDLYLDGINNNGTVSDPSQGVAISKKRTDSRGLDEILLGILGTFVWQPNDRHQYAVRLIGNQSAEDEARFQLQDTGYPSAEQNQSLHYTERTVGSLQGHGQHTYDDLFGTGGRFGDLLFDWTVSGNYTRQDEPDVRFFRNAYDYSSQSARMPSNSTDAQNTRRIWRNIGEENAQAAFNLAFPFQGPGDAEGVIRAGAVTDLTNRTYDQTSYTHAFAPQAGNSRVPEPGRSAWQYNRSLGTFIVTSPGQLWTDVFLDANRIGLATNAPPAPNQLLWYAYPVGDDVNYNGDQTIGGRYVMAEVPLPGKVRITAGVRHEITDIGVVPFTNSGRVDVIELQPSGDRAIVEVPEAEATASIDTNRWLPAVSAVWEPKQGMNLRASWARTIARPTFRELAPVATEEFIFGDEYIGNTALVLSDITNYDLRWEWFRKPGEVLAVSLFSKSITSPIETISFSAANRYFIQPVNYDTGSVEGIEIEVRFPLDDAADWLKGVTVGANAAFIDSVVQVPQSEQDSLASFGLAQDERRLQGQPESLYNLNLTWDSARLGTSAGIFWSRVGEMLVTGAARGEDGSPNVFEEAYDTLDMTVGQRFKNGLAVTLKAKNLMTPERTQVYRAPGCDGYGDLPCSGAIKTQRETAWILGVTIGCSW